MRSVIAVLVASLCAVPMRAQVAAPDAGASALRYVRCMPTSEAACLTARVVIPAGMGDAASSSRWSGQLAGVRLVGPERVASGASRAQSPMSVSPVFGAPVLQGSSLGRTTLQGTLTIVQQTKVRARINTLWRPPVLALPAFSGVADSASLPDAVRDAVVSGAEVPSARVPIALLLLLLAVVLVTFVPRFLWPTYRETEEDLARQVAASRALLSAQELEQLRGTPPREGPARLPDEETRLTSRLRPL